MRFRNVLFLSTDINECEQWQSCPQRCLNKPGKHLCKCAQNYMPIANHSRSCVARGDPPYLLVAQENELLYGSVAHTLQHQLFKVSHGSSSPYTCHRQLADTEPGASLNSPGVLSNFCREPKVVLVFIHTTFR